MEHLTRPYELILLGATGYTGKLVAEWITTHLPGDLKWAIAGRNTNKLQRVVDELTKLSPDRKQPGEAIHPRRSGHAPYGIPTPCRRRDA